MKTRFGVQAKPGLFCLLMAACAINLGLTLKPALAQAPQTAGPSRRLIAVRMTMQAGSSVYKLWDGGGITLHSGAGVLEPFGAATYACGVGLKGNKENPEPGWLINMVHPANPAEVRYYFCVYRTSVGDIYVYDWIMGTTMKNGNMMQQGLGNVIVGGTGKFVHATGLLVGSTTGGGAVSQVAPRIELPVVLTKDMVGYIQIDDAN